MAEEEEGEEEEEGGGGYSSNKMLIDIFLLHYTRLSSLVVSLSLKLFISRISIL
jgi:hypothetical protein